MPNYSGKWRLPTVMQAEGAGTWPAPPFASGELWMWGRNHQGQLGQGNTTDYSSPVQVGALTDWLLAAGSKYHGSLAIKLDGTAWSWGNGAGGQLGQGSTTAYSSPVQIGALTDWSKSMSGGVYGPNGAIKTDGTLWVWGTGGTGQLGQGNTTSYSSPVQVGGLTTWASIGPGSETDAANSMWSMAIKTDGTLWAWGKNANGQLGNGNTTNYSSPIQIGALTTWIQVLGGRKSSYARKTDGTIWAWGNGGDGQLGTGSTANTSSPNQVGALTTWKTLATTCWGLTQNGLK